ncbi:hypothetical protein LY78DRAFT_426209 [Colletotrichum sublineola]|nr:hypothetical protein LY78DRAFT_426209 [Colletotrichum sublineola]
MTVTLHRAQTLSRVLFCSAPQYASGRLCRTRHILQTRHRTSLALSADSFGSLICSPGPLRLGEPACSPIAIFADRPAGHAPRLCLPPVMLSCLVSIHLSTESVSLPTCQPARGVGPSIPVLPQNNTLTAPYSECLCAPSTNPLGERERERRLELSLLLSGPP